MRLSVAQVGEMIRGEVVGDGAVELTGLATAEHAQAGDLTFAENEEYFAAAEQSRASAILVSGGFVSANKPLIRVPNARVALARVLPAFFPPEKFEPGIDPSARISPAAQVAETAHIGPHCVVGARARVGARNVLMGGNHIGQDVQLGEDVQLFPNVVIYARTEIGNRVTIHAGAVIGADGFGYVFDEGRHQKILQIGKVIIQDEVEIGANSTVDRGAMGPTMVGAGTKIDNLVHVAHNVVIGRHCILMGQAGIAGSTRMGDYAVLAAQAGVSGHLNLGNQIMIGAKSGVMRDIPDGGKVLGIPAAPDKQAKRQMIALTQLPELIRRIRELEKQVEQLSKKI